jgi:predicted  nucleic acid-binding Zn-ribbon protein
MDALEKELRGAKERQEAQERVLVRSARRVEALEGESSALKVALQAVRFPASPQRTRQQ